MEPNEIELDKHYKLKVKGTFPEYKKAEVKQTLASARIVLPADFDWTWKTAKGKLPKRIERYLVNETDATITVTIADALMKLGNQVAACIPPDETVEFAFTEKLTWKNGDFGDSGSCFWGGSVAHRGILQDNGARAVQFFKDGKGYARCWCVEYEGSPLLFNGYGLTTEQISAVVSEFLDANVYRCTLRLGDVYTNGDGAWYISKTPAKRKEISMPYKQKFTCKHCGQTTEEGDGKNLGFDEKTLRNHVICKACQKIIISCPVCQGTWKKEDLVKKHYELVNTDGLTCPKCTSAIFLLCAKCEEPLLESEGVWKKEGTSERRYCKKHA